MRKNVATVDDTSAAALPWLKTEPPFESFGSGVENSFRIFPTLRSRSNFLESFYFEEDRSSWRRHEVLKELSLCCWNSSWWNAELLINHRSCWDTYKFVRTRPSFCLKNVGPVRSEATQDCWCKSLYNFKRFWQEIGLRRLSLECDAMLRHMLRFGLTPFYVKSQLLLAPVFEPTTVSLQLS